MDDLEVASEVAAQIKAGEDSEDPTRGLYHAVMALVWLKAAELDLDTRIFGVLETYDKEEEPAPPNSSNREVA